MNIQTLLEHLALVQDLLFLEFEKKSIHTYDALVQMMHMFDQVLLDGFLWGWN